MSLQSGTGQAVSAVGIMDVTKAELQYQAILIINILVHYDDDWLPKHPPGVITNLLKIWVAESFQERHKKVVSRNFVIHHCKSVLS